MTAVVQPEGWHNWNKPNAEQTSFYAEFDSSGAGANPAARVKWAKPLAAAAAGALTSARVLAGGDGWNPAGAASVHLVLVGDSTVNDHSGCGRGLPAFYHVGGHLTNTAQNGRSSKSFAPKAIGTRRWRSRAIITSSDSATTTSPARRACCRRS